MEKITLRPVSNEIVVNHGSAEGAVDVFSYGADDAASRGLGALYVIGHRDDDSTNMGYIVSLIAALARREYYAQPGTPPREAFARTLRKANEVVEEFFRGGDARLSVGIVAVAAGQIMVSKLDKFKILLAREDQVIDILSNVLLFSKEHTEKRRFSSIIHGSIQSGDRILAFVPTRATTTRERNLRTLFLKLPQHEFAEYLSRMGQEHASFAATMLHIDIAQTTEPAVMPSPQPPELMPPPVIPDSPAVIPSLVAQPSTQSVTPAAPVAWIPRQQSAPAPSEPFIRTAPVAAPPPPQVEPEMPRLIPTEFSLGTRRTAASRWLSRLQVIRFDTRGKAIALGLCAVVIVGAVLITKSVVLTSPQERELQQALLGIQGELELARQHAAGGSLSDARAMLTRALTMLDALGADTDESAALDASLMQTLDEVDRAQTVDPTLLASPAPDAASILLATWASPSQTIRIAGTDSSGSVWIGTLRDGAPADRAPLDGVKADRLIGWRGSAVALDTASRAVSRIVGSEVKTYIIPVQETILDAVEFADSLYILTDATILKVSDLDTDKPVTKRWLTDDAQLTPDAQRLFVDGSVYTFSTDGTFTTYYKGAKVSDVSVPLAPNGVWRLLPWSDGMFAVAAGDVRRIYLFDPADGTLVRTLKVESQIPFTHIAPGPDLSALFLTAEGKLWQVK